MKNISDFLITLSPDSADQPCIVTAEGREITRSQFRGSTLGFAKHFYAQGVHAGARVGVLFVQDEFVLAAHLALAALNATGVTLPAGKSLDELAAKIRDSRLDFVVLAQATQKLQTALPSLTQIALPDSAEKISAKEPQSWFKEGQLFRVCESSGSTGTAKLVPITHEQQWQRLTQRSSSMPIEQGDQLLLAISLATEVGMTYALYFLVFGGVVVLPQQPTPEGVLTVLQKRQTQWMLTSPYLWKRVLECAATQSLSTVFQHLKLLLVGSKVDRQIVDQTNNFKQVVLYSDYGSTETGMLALARLTDGNTPAEYMGHLLEGVQCKTFHPETFAPLESHQAGLLGFQAPGIFTGYDATVDQDSPFIDGWFITGDLGWVDPNRQLHVTGRLGNVINYGGYKFNPEPLERQIAAALPVEDCCIVMHDVGGKDVLGIAVCGLKESLSEEKLIELVKNVIPAFLVPEACLILQTFPRLPSGKLDRRGLDKLILAQLGNRVLN